MPPLSSFLPGLPRMLSSPEPARTDVLPGTVPVSKLRLSLPALNSIVSVGPLRGQNTTLKKSNLPSSKQAGRRSNRKMSKVLWLSMR